MRREATFVVGGAVVALVASLLSGCSKGDDCQSGAESSVGAVQELLAASVDGDTVRACVVTSAMPDDELAANLQDIAAFVAGAGGIDALSVAEDEAQAMGSARHVEVAAMDSTARVGFTVIQSGGRYLVGISDVAGDHGPATDPSPPPAAPSPSDASDA